MDLDEPRHIAEIDEEGMLERLLTLAGQVRNAWSQVQAVTLPSSYQGAAQVVIGGMGGSAIGGDLTRTLVERGARVPISVVRGYDLPGFVGPQTLVVLSSFSGSTEETLSLGEQALERGARIIAITTGGVLASRANQAGFPQLGFAFLGQPREAIGYSMLLMLGVLARLGYVPDHTTDVEHAASLLEVMAGELGPSAPADANPAKRLAQKLFQRVPVVYGGGLMAEVARCWKGQFNENAKNWAFYEQLPELNHNAVLGYQFPTDMERRHVVIILSSHLNHPRIGLREAVAAELLGRWGVMAERFEARGLSPLEHIMSATYFGDFVSFYLALVNEVDPSDTSVLDFFKQRMGVV